MSCDECPKCDTCGAPVTTGLMAVFCPRKDCEFMPPEGLPSEFQAWREQEQKRRADQPNEKPL